jgi:hypothetical protein
MVLATTCVADLRCLSRILDPDYKFLIPHSGSNMKRTLQNKCTFTVQYLAVNGFLEQGNTVIAGFAAQFHIR